MLAFFRTSLTLHLMRLKLYIQDIVLIILLLAERAGFEPATEITLCHLSRVVT
jgi:hypothetical protein